MCMYIYIYIYTYACVCLSLSIYIYIYVMLDYAILHYISLHYVLRYHSMRPGGTSAATSRGRRGLAPLSESNILQVVVRIQRWRKCVYVCVYIYIYMHMFKQVKHKFSGGVSLCGPQASRGPHPERRGKGSPCR